MTSNQNNDQTAGQAAPQSAVPLAPGVSDAKTLLAQLLGEMKRKADEKVSSSSAPPALPETLSPQETSTHRPFETILPSQNGFKDVDVNNTDPKTADGWNMRKTDLAVKPEDEKSAFSSSLGVKMDIGVPASFPFGLKKEDEKADSNAFCGGENGLNHSGLYMGQGSQEVQKPAALSAVEPSQAPSFDPFNPGSLFFAQSPNLSNHSSRTSTPAPTQDTTMAESKSIEELLMELTNRKRDSEPEEGELSDDPFWVKEEDAPEGTGVAGQKRKLGDTETGPKKSKKKKKKDGQATITKAVQAPTIDSEVEERKRQLEEMYGVTIDNPELFGLPAAKVQKVEGPTAKELEEARQEERIRLEHAKREESFRKKAAGLPCEFWKARRCIQGAECPFSHDGEGGTWTSRFPCRFFKAGTCYRGNVCQFSHDLKDEPCIFFLKGSCQKGDACEFSHEPLTEDQKRVQEHEQKRWERRQKRVFMGPCLAFHLDDACPKGDECEYSHEPISIPEKVKLREQKEQGIELPKPKREPCPFFHSGRRCWKENSCTFSHDPMTEEERAKFERDHPNLFKKPKGPKGREPCVFFHLNMGCWKGDACPYSHDPMTPEDRAKFDQEQREYAERKRQKDAGSGAIPDEDQAAFDHKQHSFKKAERGRQPCVWFHLGKECYKGDSCPHSHDPMTPEEKAKFDQEQQEYRRRKQEDFSYRDSPHDSKFKNLTVPRNQYDDPPSAQYNAPFPQMQQPGLAQPMHPELLKQATALLSVMMQASAVNPGLPLANPALPGAMPPTQGLPQQPQPGMPDLAQLAQLSGAVSMLGLLAGQMPGQIPGQIPGQMPGMTPVQPQGPMLVDQQYEEPVISNNHSRGGRHGNRGRGGGGNRGRGRGRGRGMGRGPGRDRNDGWGREGVGNGEGARWAEGSETGRGRGGGRGRGRGGGTGAHAGTGGEDRNQSAVIDYD